MNRIAPFLRFLYRLERAAMRYIAVELDEPATFIAVKVICSGAAGVGVADFLASEILAGLLE